MESEQKFKNRWDRFWNEMNPEGVTNKDGIFMFIFVIGTTLFFSNLAMWLSKPEQSWIGDILFPMK